MSAAAELASKRKRTPRLCPLCGEKRAMLAVQKFCSSRCRQRAFRARAVILTAPENREKTTW